MRDCGWTGVAVVVAELGEVDGAGKLAKAPRASEAVTRRYFPRGAVTAWMVS